MTKSNAGPTWRDVVLRASERQTGNRGNLKAGAETSAGDKKNIRDRLASQPDDPNRLIPLRLVPFITGWSVAETLAAFHERQLDRYYLLTGYEYDPKTGAERVARPELYRGIARKLDARKATEEDQIRALPAYHFVRADALRWAFCDYVDSTVGREEAAEAGLGLVWNPATNHFQKLIDQSPDFAKVLGKPLGRRDQRVAKTEARIHEWQRMVERIARDRPGTTHTRACQILEMELKQKGESVSAAYIRRVTKLSKV